MTTTCSERVSPQSRTIIVLKKKAPKSPQLGIPASTLKFKRRQSNKTQKLMKQQAETISKEMKKPSKKEPSLSKNDSIDNERLPSTSTIKKGEGFQWESTQCTLSSTNQKPPPITIARTLKSLNFKSSNDDDANEDDEELKEYYKLLNEKW